MHMRNALDLEGLFCCINQVQKYPPKPPPLLFRKEEFGVIITSLHDQFPRVFPQASPGFAVQIEHVAASINLEAQAVRIAHRGHLVDQDFRGEIGGDLIGEAMRDKHAQGRIEGHHALQIGQRLRAARVAPVPGAVDVFVEVLIACFDRPAKAIAGEDPAIALARGVLIASRTGSE